MIKFDAEEDKAKVINGGPWKIYDHYLAVRQWEPTFNAATATIDKTMVWIRIPSLNLVYYDESVLWAIASMVGKPVKVDLQTLKVARGRFAHMCGEIDLTQPVVGRVGANGEWYHVQYEGLHVISTQCGCYGHVLKECATPPLNNAQKNDVITANNSGVEKHKQDDVEPQPITREEMSVMDHGVNSENHGDDGIPTDLHGNWIKVERKKRNHKFNARGSEGAQKGMFNNLHKSKFIGNNGGDSVTLDRPKQNSNVSVHEGGNFNLHSWVKKKTKRMRNDVSGPNRNVSVTNKLSESTPSIGIYKGGSNTNNVSEMDSKNTNNNEATNKDKNVSNNKIMGKGNTLNMTCEPSITMEFTKESTKNESSVSNSNGVNVDMKNIDGINLSTVETVVSIDNANGAIGMTLDSPMQTH
jgi:hypothetical protein